MSQENIELVRAALDAYNRGDWESLLKDAAPEFEFDLSRAAGPARGVYGRGQAMEVVAEFAASWESARLEPREVIDAGQYVIVPLTGHFVGRDGIKVQARLTWTFTVQDGAIARACMYQERHEALAAAGLSE